MKMPIRGLFTVMVAGFACILPASHAHADTIYVGCALDGIIRQYATNGGNLVLTNGISGPVRFFRLSNP